MSKEQLYIFDTTLRDGAQTQGVDFSIDDKEKIINLMEKIDNHEDVNNVYSNFIFSSEV